MRKKQKYPPSKCIAIDVDGTLLIRGKLNKALADWVKGQHDNGIETILWSARGKAHATKVAQSFDIEYHFDSIISKPGYIVDDLGWSWTKYTRVIKNGQF